MGLQNPHRRFDSASRLQFFFRPILVKPFRLPAEIAPNTISNAIESAFNTPRIMRARISAATFENAHTPHPRDCCTCRRKGLSALAVSSGWTGVYPAWAAGQLGDTAAGKHGRAYGGIGRREEGAVV